MANVDTVNLPKCYCVNHQCTQLILKSAAFITSINIPILAI